MKQYPHILAKVYETPWVITQAKYRTIQNLVESRLLAAGPQAGFWDADDEAEEDDEPNFTIEGDTAIIPVHGILGKHLSNLEMMCGGCDVDVVSTMIYSALSDQRVKQIAFDFRSPGGEVTGVPELGDQIAGITTRKTVAFTDSECCSGAVWLATQAQSFYCTQSAQTGSIGVYLALLDRSKALQEMGTKINAISAGKWKLSGAWFRPLQPEEKAMFQAQVDKIHAQFKAAVMSRRQIADEFLQGQVIDGDQAVEIGLCDGLVSCLGDLID